METLKQDAVDRFTAAVTQSDTTMVQVVSLPSPWLVRGLIPTDQWWWGKDRIFLVYSGEREEHVAMFSSDEIGGVLSSLAKAWLATTWPRLFSWLSTWKA
jgi:hypothetical protein